MAVSKEILESQSQDKQDGDFPKARHIFGLMGFLGFAVVYAMRVNLSVAIVTMVNQTAISRSNSTSNDQTCAIEHITTSSNTSTFVNHHRQIEGEFDWDETTQGIVLGSFYYGYILTQIPGGRIAEIYGGKIIYGIGVATCALFTIVTPFAARWSLWAMIGVRFVAGFCEGVTYPAIHVMMSHWVPPLERSSFSALVYCGSYIGTFLSMPLSGFLCNLTFLGGWPLTFYVPGILGLVWFVFWMYLVYEWPRTHPRISLKEMTFIEQNVNVTSNDVNGNERTPWLSILTSLPLWAIAVTQFGWSFSFFTLMSELPTYMSQILHFDIQSNSALSGLPFLTTYIMGVVCCYMAEQLLKAKKLSVKTSYRLWNSIAMMIPGLGLIGVALVGCNAFWVMVMLAGLGAFNGAIFASIQLNHINLSPKYAGTMYGMTNTLGCMTGFIGPYVTGLIINGNNTLAQWRYVFYLTAGLGMAGNVFYLIFLSTEEQSWSKNSRSR